MDAGRGRLDIALSPPANGPRGPRPRMAGYVAINQGQRSQRYGQPELVQGCCSGSSREGGRLRACKHPLQEVFGEGDAVRRRTAIWDFYTEDCVLYAPPGVFVGHDALDKFAGELRATHPHFVYTPHGKPQALHNGGILAWGSGPKGEAPEYTGLDVVIIRDGKIAALYVFLNPKFA